MSALKQALRPMHWAKNALIFLPVVASHQLSDPALWERGFKAFASFSLLASSIYVFNDLLDLASDRQHPLKRHRPFASGKLSLETGIALFLGLAGLAYACGHSLGGAYFLIWGTYLTLNLAYSCWLKRMVIVDVIVLTVLHIVRILAGAAACHIIVSNWLMSFSCFFFFGLATFKRYCELRINHHTAELPGRGYRSDDQEALFTIGLGTSLISALVFALYLDSPQVNRLYQHPGCLWMVIPLILYWISRMWLLARRKQVADDPVAFALQDIPSWVVMALLGLVLYISS